MKNTKILKYGFIAYSILLVCQIFLHFVHTFNDYRELYEGWGFADWLINYEGGFVRRGILGQIILCLNQQYGMDIGVALHTISLLSTIALVVLMIVIFYKKKLSMLILPTAVMIGTFAMNDMTSFRRDQLMLLIIFLAFYFYRKYISNKKAIYYLLFSITGILVILIHEASFFCFVPFIFIHQCNKLQLKDFFKSALFLLPIVAAMGVCCIFKGDETTANIIWNSYQPYFIEIYGEPLSMGAAVDALTWETAATMKFHMEINYSMPLCLLGWLTTYFLTFYLCANVNRVKIFSYEKEEVNSAQLTGILLVQFISLLPMFTVLSCDLGRITMYWTITSFFIYALFDNAIKFPFLVNCSEKINMRFNAKPFSSKKLYIIICTFIACPLIYYTFEAAFDSIVLGNIRMFFRLIGKITGL